MLSCKKKLLQQAHIYYDIKPKQYSNEQQYAKLYQLEINA